MSIREAEVEAEPASAILSRPVRTTEVPTARHISPGWWLLRSWPKAVVTFCDAAGIGAGMVLAWTLSDSGARQAGNGRHATLGWLMAVGLALHWAFFVRGRLYLARYVTRGADEIRRTVEAIAMAHVALVVTLFAAQIHVARSWVLLSFVIVATLVVIERMILREGFDRLRLDGWMLRSVIVVGSNAEGQAICEMLLSDPSLGYRVVGLIEDRPADASVERLGVVDSTLAAVRASGATGVVLATSALDLADTNRLVRELTDNGVHVELSSSLRDIASHRLTVRPLGRFPVAYVEPVKRYGWRPIAKRCFDIVAASIALVIAAPVLLVASVAIKLDSPGTVIFRQTRVGRGGKVFKVLKLRTMVADAEQRLAEVAHLNEADGPLFKVAGDPRITRVGRLLRKSSLDEVPQLLNVLKGEMSIVGPRPALPLELALWDDELRGRLRVAPGITGMWQVSGRSDVSFADYARLDLYYVDNWSLLTDVAIVLRTIPAVLKGSGAR